MAGASSERQGGCTRAAATVGTGECSQPSTGCASPRAVWRVVSFSMHLVRQCVGMSSKLMQSWKYSVLEGGTICGLTLGGS